MALDLRPPEGSKRAKILVFVILGFSVISAAVLLSLRVMLWR